jgi:hypothetical protein
MLTLLLSVLLAAGPEVEAQTLEGKTVAGTLSAISAKQVTLETANGPVTLEAANLLGLSFKLPAEKKPDAPPPAPGAWVELVDGSTFAGRDYAAQGGKARVTLLDGEVLEVPTADVATVRLQPAADAVGKEWARIVDMKIDGDLLVVRKDEAVDYHKGVLGTVTDQTVGFTLDGEKIPVKRPKVLGLVYYHAGGRELPAQVCTVTDASGAVWSVRGIEMTDKVRWTTQSGLAAARPLASVAKIDYSAGKVAFLSDLKFESSKFTPFFNTDKDDLPTLFLPRNDLTSNGKPLKLGGTEYAKGLCLHSRTEMVYRLPGSFRQFKAVIGVDDAERDTHRVYGGNLVLVIRGDDKVLLETTVSGKDEPKPVELDLTGIRRLTVFVDYGEDSDRGDHLDLCNARIIK